MEDGELATRQLRYAYSVDRYTLGGSGVELTSVGVLGEPAHGVFSLGADSRVVLARLDRLLPRELRSLVVGARPLLVPRSDERRFVDEFVPGLRRHAAAPAPPTTPPHWPALAARVALLHSPSRVPRPHRLEA